MAALSIFDGQVSFGYFFFFFLDSARMTERRVTGVMAILTCCARAPCLFDQPSCRRLTD